MTKLKQKSPRASVQAVNANWILVILIWTFAPIVAYICLATAPIARLAKVPLIATAANVVRYALTPSHLV